MSASFAETSEELAETELCVRLSSESRHMFRDDVAAAGPPSTETVVGWRRYSVSFGAGRMGLEFEYDARATRRLVVTRASREAEKLGVRPRDVLIGVGQRAVPRGTDPNAVHRHLVECDRPVALHFYRLHVRRGPAAETSGAIDAPAAAGAASSSDEAAAAAADPAVHKATPPPPKEEDDAASSTVVRQPPPGGTPPRATSGSFAETDGSTRIDETDATAATANGASQRGFWLAAAVWERLPGIRSAASTGTSRGSDDAADDALTTAPLDAPVGDQRRRQPSDPWPAPALVVDETHYRIEDDDDDAGFAPTAAEHLASSSSSSRRRRAAHDASSAAAAVAGADGTGDDDTPRWECLLEPALRSRLARQLKPVLRSKAWVLLYDTACDGMILEALYNRAKLHPDGPQILLVRDDQRHVAGAFVDETIRNVGDYFGTGECFVFECPRTGDRAAHARQHPSAPPRGDDADDADDGALVVHRWVGPATAVAPGGPDDGADEPATSHDAFDPPPMVSIDNDMFIYATNEVLGFGSGGGGFAIRLDEALEYGASRPCATYGNDHSLFAGRDVFPVQRVQLWAFASQWLS